MLVAERSVTKVTVSLPVELVRYADQLAASGHRSRSQVISQAIAELRQRQQDDAAREGYAFYAGESEQFAEASLSAVSEAIGRNDG